MLYPLSKIFWIVVQPGNLLVLLLALGVIGAGFGLRRARLLVVLATLAMLAIAVLPLGAWTIVPLEERFPQPALPPRIDGIILLGGAVNLPITRAHGQVALNRFAERITETLALARLHPEARVLVSGGDPGLDPGGLTEAQAMRTLLLALGLDERRLLLEERSRNTYENAVYSKALAQPQPGQVWLLVTSSFHMPRAVGCFRAAGFAVLPYPVDYQTDGHSGFGFSFDTELSLFDLALHEWVGLAAYRLLGRVDSLFPGPAPISSMSAR
jgi:uncharacterized SAM-binding protein YcdF (DUF218 family)